MANIRELNRKRIELGERAKLMGAVNSPTDPDERLASDARYRLINDAWMKAEAEYQRAIASLSPDDLAALATPSS